MGNDREVLPHSRTHKYRRMLKLVDKKFMESSVFVSVSKYVPLKLLIHFKGKNGKLGRDHLNHVIDPKSTQLL